MPTDATTLDAEEVFVTRGRPVLRFAVVAALLISAAQLLVATSALVPSLSLGDAPFTVRPEPGGATTVAFELRNDGAASVHLRAVSAGPGTEIHNATLDGAPLQGSRLDGGTSGVVELQVQVDCAVAPGIAVRVEGETFTGLRRTTDLLAIFDETRPRTGRGWTGQTTSGAVRTSRTYCLP